ncbi:hypothetical protein ACFONC_11465 [Luteimonas soli]|uniref:Uncharacterized protein n=1 Tax=Luteimonas soli TaxID=1648966 RepID=A0ABV7XP16_9GAMM
MPIPVIEDNRDIAANGVTGLHPAAMRVDLLFCAKLWSIFQSEEEKTCTGA